MTVPSIVSVGIMAMCVNGLGIMAVVFAVVARPLFAGVAQVTILFAFVGLLIAAVAATDASLAHIFIELVR